MRCVLFVIALQGLLLSCANGNTNANQNAGTREQGDSTSITYLVSTAAQLKCNLLAKGSESPQFSFTLKGEEVVVKWENAPSANGKLQEIAFGSCLEGFASPLRVALRTFYKSDGTANAIGLKLINRSLEGSKNTALYVMDAVDPKSSTTDWLKSAAALRGLKIILNESGDIVSEGSDPGELIRSVLPGPVVFTKK